MIVSIKGKIAEAHPLQVILDVNGLGYEVNIPLTTTENLPPIGHSVKLFTHSIYREDSQALYGFISRQEREFFKLLVEKVSGIGPKIALSIMSKLSVPVLENAIAASDVSFLTRCPGIGKKTAERLIIELRDKILPTNANTVPFQNNTSSETTSNVHHDAVAALVALGYKPQDADKSIRKAFSNLDKNPTTEALIKSALN